jgi:CHASE3 domain sensor protein
MKEQIQKRIEELMAQGKQMEVNLHMINGALQQCQWQLAELDKEVPKAEETQ